ncbi:MAG: bifunctional 3,4-dihydroxy-2-butanone-4-phosphate synthase/GTP cyclohydrolase II [Planctomycetota bacterium]
MQQEINSHFCDIDEALKELRAGRMVILVDDEDRENEGDLTCAAEKITPEIINFMVTEARGWVCLTLTRPKCEELDLPPMVKENQARFRTAFTVTIEAAEGVSTGISAQDRAHTILTVIQEGTKKTDLVRPGHIQPIMAKEGGVLQRAGQTEGSVDLCRLAGLKPAGVICEIMNPDGTMSRMPQLMEFAKKHQIKICSIADLIKYRTKREKLIERCARHKLKTPYGEFDMFGYISLLDGTTHIALSMGISGESLVEDPLLIRVHSSCVTGDIFHSLRCDCGAQKDMALEAIGKEGRGVFLYLNQEGRGIGLINKMKAYHLQELGLDTVEANQKLGFRPDERDYGIGAQILKNLGVQKMRLMTNNPRKFNALSGFELEITEIVPLEAPANKENEKYLRTKKEKLGHMFSKI